MDLEKQEEKELEPYVRALQKDAQTVVDIEMKYGEKWARAADTAARQSWKDTKAAFGCSPEEALSPLCDYPALFFTEIPRSLEVCKCTKFPVQISNSKMECSMSASGQYMCSEF